MRRLATSAHPLASPRGFAGECPCVFWWIGQDSNLRAFPDNKRARLSSGIDHSPTDPIWCSLILGITPFWLAQPLYCIETCKLFVDLASMLLYGLPTSATMPSTARRHSP